MSNSFPSHPTWHARLLHKLGGLARRARPASFTHLRSLDAATLRDVGMEGCGHEPEAGPVRRRVRAGTWSL